ncbi:hypothetical protein [Paenibacillus soyae]|uniref:Uncharacterized protein n=1 Tax=Paenibacillus soyae TaxID=2969249 RepID=A0A9X2SCX6_9BACL|nr:hypothetical protein [Paenibacillus soyae]MCR2806572.1 hypothetical protein [Paenibacillus soyae]
MRADEWYSWNVVGIAVGLLSWVTVLYLLVRGYRKQETKPAIWKMLFAALVGFFSFSFKVPLFGQMVNIALLPLGVWILSWFIRRRSWPRYRKFAWTGFWANYLFLATALLAGFVHSALYDKNDPHTYLADTRDARIAGTHPSAREAEFDEELFREAMASAASADMKNSLDWYYESRHQNGELYQEERFPYALFGAKPRWGSGLIAAVYLESDGKGLLLASEGRYYYYRSEKPMMEWEAEE